MKKTILLVSAFSCGLLAMGQHHASKLHKYATKSELHIDEESMNVPYKKPSVLQEKATTTIPLGSSYNVYSILRENQNQVAYNPELNTLTFVHRQNDGETGGSGIISFDYSTDGGSTWTINPFQLTPTQGGGNGNRYPNMTIYNPAANTDPANAYVVAVGPALFNHSSNGNGWAQSFRATSKLDGTNLDEGYFANSAAIGADPYDWDFGGLTTNPNGDMFFISSTTNNTGNTANDTMSYRTYYINKGVFNATSNTVDWTVVKEINPDWHKFVDLATSAPTYLAGIPNMAFSPDGQIGYAILMGAEKDIAQKTPRPIVFQTIDGGSTWTQLPNYDFSQDPLLQRYLIPSNSNTTKPFFSDYDCVVDKDGYLHIFTHMMAGTSEAPDSAYYIRSSPITQYMMEATRNDNGWSMNFVDSIFVEDGAIGSTDPVSVGPRPQASRNADGSIIVYTWLTSDPAFGTLRDFPNVTGVAKNMTTNKWTHRKDLSSGNDAQYMSYFQTIAPVCITNGADFETEIPLVYGVHTDNPLSAINYHFLKGVGFNANEFVKDSLFYVTGINSYKSLASVGIFPNPSNGLFTVSVNDRQINQLNIQVLNIVGEKVLEQNALNNTTTIDAAELPKGTYLVRIQSGNALSVKKLIIE